MIKKKTRYHQKQS